MLAKIKESLFYRTLLLRLFGFWKIPLIFYVRPRITVWTAESLVCCIPLRRRTKNHLNGMYFGVLAVGADLAGGFMAFEAARLSGKKVSLIFKSMEAQFLKRAEGDVYFSCNQGVALADLVARAISTKERVEIPVDVVATVPSHFGADPVARFTLVISMKLAS